MLRKDCSCCKTGGGLADCAVGYTGIVDPAHGAVLALDASGLATVVGQACLIGVAAIVLVVEGRSAVRTHTAASAYGYAFNTVEAPTEKRVAGTVTDRGLGVAIAGALVRDIDAFQ